MFSKLKNLLKSKQDMAHKPESVVSANSIMKKEVNDDGSDTIAHPDNELNAAPTEKKNESNFTKKGVRRIDSDEEMLAHFGVENENAVSPEESKPQSPRRIPKQSKRVKKRKTDKHGFPVIDSSDDLLMMMEEADQPGTNHTVHDASLKTVSKSRQPSLKDKHGIPILRQNEDYQAFLGGDENPESFSEILERSLGQKTTEVLLREKRDFVGKRKPLTLKKRLSRYPLPQGQLDLHGYTSIKADMKTESYIKNAFYQGTYTVRIIVGKGLHSEGGAVLPDVVEQRIISLKKEKIVLAYEWDNKKKSKSGALTVYLDNVHP